jgi:basic membrane protein A
MLRPWSAITILTLALLPACKRGGAPGPAATGPRIGLVTDVGGRGDQSFNDSALRGLEAWAGGLKHTPSGYQPLPEPEWLATVPEPLRGEVRPLGARPIVLQSKAQEDYEPNLGLLVSEGVDLAMGIGFMLENAVEAVAKKHPQTRFLLVDSPLLDASGKPYSLPNVMTVIFRENEGSFLAGALAALASKSGKVGFVGGMEIPLIKKFEAGFFAGARTIWPDGGDRIRRVYTGSFDNSSAGKRAALELYRQGVDVVFHAAGGDGLGVIQAAREQGKLAIGVDSDQHHLAPENVLTSMVKRVDYVVYLAAKAVAEKSFQGGDRALGLAANGVALAPVRLDFPGKTEALARVEGLRKAVVEGRIAVPATLEELSAFRPPPTVQ